MDQDHDDLDLELLTAMVQLEESAPPGWEVVDVWRCKTCCTDIHALVLPPADAPPPNRAERRGAARARGRRARHG